MALEEKRSIDLVAPPGEPQEVVLHLVRLLQATAPGHSPELVLRAARLHRDTLAEFGYGAGVLAPLDTFAASLACSNELASTRAVIPRR
jgi:hypothetical protein